MTRNRPLPVPLEALPFVLVRERLVPPLEWAPVFGRSAPVELEIGSGKGLFLVEAARQRPDADFIGVERAGKWFRRAAGRLLRAELPNVRIVQADAFDFLSRFVPAGTVRRVHVYFPDPWPKKRHARRRLLGDELYRLAARALQAGGELRLASDVQGYFEEAIGRLEEWPGFRREGWPDGDEGLPTSYAVKYRKEGRAIWCARFVWEGAATAAAQVPPPPSGPGALDAPSAPVLGSPAGGVA